ncbi:UBX domain-containing protein 1-A SAPK substrate protein 1-A [Channa argus]|uniref:UBX domain-containing protein 1-A SAPK substrate protein 1-A n=1 Tax=Channa argus TaxID=215402 RepID=A0A6G1QMM8_CHAAH|nr:UBX domain-containing protein 1-A SAPK substrate protein 1-A [Channa argus]
MSSTASSTIGELFLILSEMGFTEEQIQLAVQAGHFSVPDAAEWLLQGQYPRHRLVKQSSQPAETAFSAFNPPKEAASTSQSHASPTESTACPSLVLRPSQSCTLSPEPLPVESRIKQDKSDFAEQERLRVAQEARAERRQKKQERELVLKRIAEDRKTLQEKTQTSAVTEKTQTSAGTETTPPSGEGQKLGGKTQTNLDNNCILMIRLPSGESMRERFPADAPLRSVMEHIIGRYPSLPPFSLLQGFPRKRFGEADLVCSLRSLGLTPNAALCIQTTPPETPQDPQSPAEPPSAGQNEPSPCSVPPYPHLPVVEDAVGQDLVFPPPLPNQLWEEAVNYAGIPGIGQPVSGPSHLWGRGQRLVPDNAEEAAEIEVGEEQEGEEEPPHLLNGMQRLPFFPEHRMQGGFGPRYHWPDQGNRLREAPAEDPAEPENAGGRVAPVAAGLAAVERLQRAAQLEDAHASQVQPSPPKKPFRTPSVPSLCALATRATVHLMTAPSMQYSSSLAGLTPELAELLLNHMSRERLLRPRTLEFFFGCPLQKFVLNCYPYSTNELLRHLRAFTALKHLSLVNSPLITDSGLSILSSLVKLQYLNLASCSKLTDSCLQHITGLKSLCFLSMDQTKVTDAGMVQYLRSAPSCLTQLSLNQTAVTEATLAVLPTCVPQLRILSIKQTKVENVSALADLSSLQTLNLDGTGVKEESLKYLATLPSLLSLSLAGIPVTDGNQALQIISGLKLTHLTLPGRHSVNDIGLSFLSSLSLLIELDLTDYTQVTDQGVKWLSTMTRLKKLSLSNTQVTDAGLPSLRGLQELQELCLDRTAVTSRGVAELITCLPHLQVLGLASTQVGDTVMRTGVIRCNQLVKLNLSRTRITDHGLKFLKHMHLAQVNLDGTGVSLIGIASLLSHTNISSIRASNTRTIPIDDVSDEEWEAQ